MAEQGRPRKPKYGPDESAKRVLGRACNKRERDKLIGDLCFYWRNEREAVLCGMELPPEYDLSRPGQPRQPSHAQLPLEALELLIERVPDWQSDAAINEQVEYQKERLGHLVGAGGKEAKRIRAFLQEIDPGLVLPSGQPGIQEELAWSMDGFDDIRREFNDAFDGLRTSGELAVYLRRCPQLRPWVREDKLKAFFLWILDQCRACNQRARTGKGPGGRSDLAYLLWDAVGPHTDPKLRVLEDDEDEVEDEDDENEDDDKSLAKELLAVEGAAVGLLDELIYRRRGMSKRSRDTMRSNDLPDGEGEDKHLTPHEVGLKALADAVGSTPKAVKQAIKRGRGRAESDENRREQ